MNFKLEGCATAQAVGLWPLKAEVWVRSHVSPCGICGGQYGTRTSFSPSTSVFPCQYHSTDAPYSFLSTFSFYQKDKQAKPGNLKEQSSLVYRGTLDRRVPSSLHSPPVCLPASGGPQFKSSACLIYTKTEAATISTVWCCYLELTVRTADYRTDSAYLSLSIISAISCPYPQLLTTLIRNDRLTKLYTSVDRSSRISEQLRNV